MQTNYKQCKTCGSKLENWIKIDNIWKNISSRINCLKCLPFKSLKKPKPQVKLDHKLCTKCNVILPISSFSKRRGRVNGHTYCKKCQNTYNIDLWIKRKFKAINYKGDKCEHCGIASKHYAIYDFHHTDRSKKEFEWDKLKKRSWSAIVQEIDKCKLLCANCHRIEHENRYCGPIK